MFAALSAESTRSAALLRLVPDSAPTLATRIISWFAETSP